MLARVLLLALIFGFSATASAQDDLRAMRQVAGILDYVGSDYAGAVDAHGNVVSEMEYREQLSLTDDALALARASLGEEHAVVRGLIELKAALERKPPPDELLRLCRRIRSDLVADGRLSLAPDAAPVLARGRALYFENGCQTCHAADGSANTDAARALDPHPANFLDADRLNGVSPYRAFYAITFGVTGTGMQAFTQLDDAQRWDLAFFVLSMRHRERDLERGRSLLAGSSVPTDAAALSSMTEADLLGRIEPMLATPADRADALAFLRARAPFGSADDDGSLAIARQLLDRGMQAYRAGERDEARRIFIAAYLDGFEPKEAALGARDHGLVLEIEASMLALRELAGRGAPIEALEQEKARLTTLLDRAEASRTNGTTAFLGALAIALREGFEAVLLVTALLALVRKRGQAKHARYVHAGWLAAIPAGLVTWLAAGGILGGMERELAEGIVALLAAAVLLGVTHWILGQASAKSWVGFIAKKTSSAAGQGAAAGVFALAFVAAYRELFEVVLFFQALRIDAPQHETMIWLGAVAGIAVLAALALGLKAIGQKLEPKPFMLASSALLAVLSLVLVGKGVHALQEAGVIGSTTLPLPELPALGVHASVETLVAQLVLFAALAWSAVVPFVRSRREKATAAAPAATPAE